MHVTEATQTSQTMAPLWYREEVTSDIWNVVSSHISSMQDLMAFRQTCKYLYTYCVGNTQWEAILKRHFPGSFAEASLVNAPKDYLKIYSDAALQIHHLKNIPTFPCHLFTESTTENMDPIFAEYMNIHEELGRVITTSKEGAIKIFDINTKKAVFSLDANTKRIKCTAQAEKVFFVNCNNQNQEVIKAWNIETGEEVPISLKIPNGLKVTCLCAHKSLLCVGLINGTILIEDRKNKKMCTLKALHEKISQMHVHKNLLLANSEDENLLIWDLEKEEKVDILTDRGVGNVPWYISGDLLCIRDRKGRVNIIEIETRKTIHSLPEEKDGEVFGMYGHADSLVITLGEERIQEWDISTGQFICELQGFDWQCSRIQFHGNFLVNHNFLNDELEIRHIGTKHCLNNIKSDYGINKFGLWKNFVITKSYGDEVYAWDLLSSNEEPKDSSK